MDVWLHTLLSSDRSQLHSSAALPPENNPSPIEIKPVWIPQPVGARANVSKTVERLYKYKCHFSRKLHGYKFRVLSSDCNLSSGVDVVKNSSNFMSLSYEKESELRDY